MSGPDGLALGETLRIFRRALRYVSPFRRLFALKVGLLLTSLVPLVLIPWPVKILIDHVIGGIPLESPVVPFPFFVRPVVDLLSAASTTEVLVWTLLAQGLLLLLVGAFGTSGRERDQTDAYLSSGHDTQTRTENEANAGFSLAGGLLGWLDFRLTIRLTQALNHHYRSRLFERIQALPMTAFDDERIGDAVYRVMIDTTSITNTCYRILLTPVGAPAALALTAFVIGVTFSNQPALVAAGLALAPLSLLATLPFAATLRRRSRRSRTAGATTTSTAEESLANVLAVQSLGAEAREQGRFDRDSWASFGRYRAVVRAGIGAFLTALVPGLLLVGWAFLKVTDLVIAGAISPGDFALLFAYFVQMAFAAVEIGALWIRLQDSAAGLHRVFLLMDLPSETDPPAARPLPPVGEGVRVEDAHFSYPDGTRALEGASFEARVGELTALVGPAGGGKTTLAHLIPRFLTPQRGLVLIDGHDVSQMTLASLRQQVAYVFQETVLFDGTVEENIRLGNPDASEAEVRRAARAAGAEEFVRRLPAGYRTGVGRGGSQLSVGQRQRLAIARALVRDAPILILDEPTSALDPHAEEQLANTLRRVARTRIVLVIAHRLSLAERADRILFLDGGRIVERGSPAELMARAGGAYRRFVELQARQAIGA